MNPGILTSGYQSPALPRGLLGVPQPVPTINARLGRDADAQMYIDSVERADGQPLEDSVRTAINDFVVGCKVDGLWPSMRVSGIFLASRTLAGALVPLTGDPVTNINFIAADYVRRSGLIGNGSNKALASRLAGDADPRDDSHCSAFVTQADTTGAERTFIQGGDLFNRTGVNGVLTTRSRSRGATIATTNPSFGLVGVSRVRLENFVQRRSGVTSQHSNASASSPGSLPYAVFAQFENGNVFNATNGRLCFYSAGRSIDLTALDARVTALYNAIGRPSSDPIFSAVTNADARLWIDNVYNNGGTVSTTTANAVNDFCNAIDAAGIRDRLLRLNLFCGSNLAAALVPLYRGTSLGGTQFGNATDLNTNFVSADYSEATGILNATGTKFLSTGVTSSQLPSASGHVAWSFSNNSLQQTGFAWGVNHTATLRTFNFVNNALSQNVEVGSSAGGGAGIFNTSIYGRWLGSRTSTSLQSFYRNGAVAASDATARGATTGGTDQFLVFRSAGGSGSRFGLNYYGFGESMTAAQAAAFDAAIAAFLTAIGRPA